MHYLKDIFYLFYPKLCVNCSDMLLKKQLYLCVFCHHNLPLIEDNLPINSSLLLPFYGKYQVENVRSFMYYQKLGIGQKIIQELKYKNQPAIGVFIANWFGEHLKKTAIFKDVDCIIPVPIHPSKLKKRGYNQLTMFGQRLGLILNIVYQPDILIKVSSAKTQTTKRRFERFLDIENTFKLTDTTFFEDKHILLIDDVMTTGATLVACCQALSVTKNIRISIATMASVQKD
ncbi:ComF family protein [Tenacibaculum piscium]|uniref:Amidophosphoribosyltransferase n=2 Tax=Tenacibaculum piscium TaxID=1458515 RepID=A0A2H1YJV1_9FLAO|nr:ComF family protein [Tenacibaculum piscium]MBE7629425.1 ComF family protein [Tenacibaculum piscium]MBE7671296.1 ComF family protein [Tenacibaculum piscium]MBE7686211.1 ComF family protein [Tenacibaculum piscium]MBE7689947.1 ComF family protein [Tenacibaculum piscium]SOS75779.1 Amidophosphoribosyltransferase [Tenacibaculum piscium]